MFFPKKLTLLLALVVLTVGCASMPPVNFNVQDVGMVDNRKSVELKSLTVGFASRSQQKVINAGIAIPPLWKSGLTDALNRSLIFQDEQKIKVNLSVRIVEFDTPFSFVEFNVKVGAIYELINRENGALLYSELIESKGVLPYSGGPEGAARRVESWNRAVRNNIADFINRLDQADLSKPIFEGRK